MAISTYDELVSAVVSNAMRTGDTEFEAAAPNFIALAESRLNRILPLRVMEVDEELTGIVGSRLIDLPSDFIEPISLHITISGSICKLTPLIAGNMPLNTANGVPSRWCVNGSEIQLDTPCSEAYAFTLRYRRSFSLSEARPTNWLLTNHPDAYLAACLVWGGVFMRSPEEALPWKQILDEAIEEISWKDARSKSIGVATVDPALSARGGFNIITG